MQTSTARRWTPSQIRKALPFPKPRANAVHARRPAPADLALLQHLAEHADVLTVSNTLDCVAPWGKTAGWLLVPAPAWVLSVLAQIGASEADLEPDEGLEAGADAEPSEDEEAGGDEEPGHVRPVGVGREGLAHNAPSTASVAQKERYRRRDAWLEAAKVRRALNARL